LSKIPYTELAQSIKEGNRNAFEELFKSFFPIGVRFASRYIGEKAFAKDIVQNIFFKLWTNRNQIDPSKSFKTYLFTMIRNASLNHVRDYNNRFDISDDLQSVENLNEQNFNFESNADELSQFFKTWISELPERQKEALELSRYEGLSHDEIAEVMNISARTVNNHIVAALKTLKEQYNQYLNRKDG